ncbi:MAG: DUF1599 domain-containing protein [Muribaculum sp.]|nr:DUF1599 domain-containing protein [Muribaculum sp.]
MSASQPQPELTPAEQVTARQYDKAISLCRDIFTKKLHDYGSSWRMLRPASVTDQILIKALRIRSLQMKGVAMVDEGILPEFIAIVNYGAIGLIQLQLGLSNSPDLDAARAIELYDKTIAETRSLMFAKNHDYDEAWRLMRVSSLDDIILQKIHRTKEIEDLGGNTLISEGVDANYQDMINYSVFAIIKLTENE